MIIAELDPDDVTDLSGRAAPHRAPREAARRAVAAAGVGDDGDARRTMLREQHRRRPTVIAMLDQAELP